MALRILEMRGHDLPLARIYQTGANTIVVSPALTMPVERPGDKLGYQSRLKLYDAREPYPEPVKPAAP